MQKQRLGRVRVCSVVALALLMTACAVSSGRLPVKSDVPYGYVPSAPAAVPVVPSRPVPVQPQARAVAVPQSDLATWLVELKKEAHGRGVSEGTWNAAMRGFAPNPKIIALDRKQPEGTHSFGEYLAKVVNAQRIRQGKLLYQENKVLLDKIAAQYDVPAHYIVALWGIETSYGKVTGGFSVPKALATLAHDGRRAAFFREELITSLLIIEQGHISAENMKGSWAGAMGQSQFMPSAFMDFAVDYDRDGHKDIWNTKADVFASIANYLHSSGWRGAEPWAKKIKLADGFDARLADIKQFRPLAFWQQHGVMNSDGSVVNMKAVTAAVMFPGKPHEGAYLISPNTSVLLKWNRSRYFATAVGTLADGIAESISTKP